MENYRGVIDLYGDLKFNSFNGGALFHWKQAYRKISFFFLEFISLSISHTPFSQIIEDIALQNVFNYGVSETAKLKVI